MASIEQKIALAELAIESIDEAGNAITTKLARIGNLVDAAEECIKARNTKLIDYALNVEHPTKRVLVDEVFPRYDEYEDYTYNQVVKVVDNLNELVGEDLSDYMNQIEDLFEKHGRTLSKVDMNVDLIDFDFDNLNFMVDSLVDLIVPEERFMAIVTAPAN